MFGFYRRTIKIIAIVGICAVLLLLALPLFVSHASFKGSSRSSELVKADLISVVDGDTIWVSVNDESVKVRLLSINAEESVHSDESKNNIYGEKASEYLKNMLSEVSEVWLQYDEDPQDTYGRELCYVWLKGDVDISAKNDIKKYMVNALLLRKGYVYTSVYEPNDTYERLFYKLERVARKNKRGLWKYKQFRTIVDEKRK